MPEPVNPMSASPDAQTPLGLDGVTTDAANGAITQTEGGAVTLDPQTGLPMADDAAAISGLPVFDLVDRVGVVGWVLAALALVGMLIFFYKLVGFIRRGIFADGFAKDVERHLSNGDDKQVAQILSRLASVCLA